MSKRRGRSAWAVLALVACAAGCLDFTPLAPDAAAVAGDGGGPGEGSTAVDQCVACASGADDAGGCANEYTQCNAISICKATVDCVIAGCFAPNVNIGACLSVCEDDGGITTSIGPPNTAFAAFLQCMSTSCEAQCLQ